MSLIKPHGAEALTPRIVSDQRKEELVEEATGLASIMVSSAAAANAVMLGAGYFTPLSGYMNRADAIKVARDLVTTEGLFWPVPVLNMVAEFNGEIGTRIALRDPNVDGNPVLAVMTVIGVDTLSDGDMSLMTREIFGTEDPAHPGGSDL